jgi:hypothetical protein
VATRIRFQLRHKKRQITRENYIELYFSCTSSCKLSECRSSVRCLISSYFSSSPLLLSCSPETLCVLLLAQLTCGNANVVSRAWHELLALLQGQLLLRCLQLACFTSWSVFLLISSTLKWSSLVVVFDSSCFSFISLHVWNNNNSILYIFTCWAQQPVTNYRVSTKYKTNNTINKTKNT